MTAPVIASDGFYSVHVMWLDGIDLDQNIREPSMKRYTENKRSTKVHSKGWEPIFAISVDAPVSMVHDGNYLKLPKPSQNMIIDRVQSWVLVDEENGISHPDSCIPVQKRKLRPGETKPKQTKANKAQQAKHMSKSTQAKAPARPPKKTQTKPAPRKKRNKKPPTSTESGHISNTHEPNDRLTTLHT
jgi:hypothetical protein